MSSFIPLATIVLPSNTIPITFSNIPASVGGKPLLDLFLTFRGSATTSDGFQIRLNGDTGANYSLVRATTRGFNPEVGWAENFSNPQLQGNLGNGTDWSIHFIDATNTGKHKGLLVRYGIGGSGATMNAIRWANNNAITSITLATVNNNPYTAGSIFSLYAIAGAL